ncbi:MAG: hypothetical protein KDD66_12915 [Bdellovibrionales bacterium]|nr:hypothetical protein [Bdellovibrionales bacterium]
MNREKLRLGNRGATITELATVLALVCVATIISTHEMRLGIETAFYEAGVAMEAGSSKELANSSASTAGGSESTGSAPTHEGVDIKNGGSGYGGHNGPGEQQSSANGGTNKYASDEPTYF